MKLLSDQESKHWSVCRAQQTSKVFVCNKQTQTGNSSTVKLCWMAAMEASMQKECSVITGPFQNHMYRRSELQHKKSKPQISNITNNIMKTHTDPNTMIFYITFLHSFSLIVKHFLLQLAKKSLTLNVLGNCSDTRTASYFTYKCKLVANAMSLNWINAFGTFILIFFRTTGYREIPSTWFT